MIGTLESYAAVRRNGVPITSRRPFETPEIDITKLHRQYDHWCKHGGFCLECVLPNCIYDRTEDAPIHKKYETVKAKAIRERNQAMLAEFKSGVTLAELARKYQFKCPDSVKNIIDRLIDKEELA